MVKCFKEKLTGLVVSFCREGFLIIAATVARFARIADQESKRWRMKRLCKVVYEVVTSDVCCNLGVQTLLAGHIETQGSGCKQLRTFYILACQFL